MTDREYPEGHDTVAGKEPCPKCGSKDNLVRYADGHAHCFSHGCGYFERATGERAQSHQPKSPKAVSSKFLSPTDTGATWDISKRGIPAETSKRFGVFRTGYSGQQGIVYPYFGFDGDLANQKVRLPDKSFPVIRGEDRPSIGDCRLFGHHVFGDKFDRVVVVTEGEDDAMAVADATNFKIAAVSLSSGAQSAVKCLKANYLWLDRFKEIVLWFDDDEAGRAAMEECAPLFAVGKVKLAKAPSGKDARDLLTCTPKRPGDIQAAIWAATTWRPKGIVNAKERPSDVLAPEGEILSWSYPDFMPKLQEMTGGIRPGDVVYHVAGTGIGKSTQLKEIAYHVTEQNIKVGLLFFEDTVADVKFGLMSIPENERLHLVPVPSPEDVDGRAAYNSRMSRIHEQTFSGGMFELFDPESAEWALEAVLGYIRYMAKALDCRVIFVDPLSFVAAGIDLSADERRVLDKVAGELARLAKELGVALQISHHLRRTQGVPHEEGAPTSINELRSSGGLANFATCVVGHERNTQAADDGWRVTQLRIIKPVRRTGRSGPADLLYYGENGRLIQSPIPFPPVGKPDAEGQGAGGGQSRSGSFGAIDY